MHAFFYECVKQQIIGDIHWRFDYAMQKHLVCKGEFCELHEYQIRVSHEKLHCLGTYDQESMLIQGISYHPLIIPRFPDAKYS
jgi:hypothetical protein